MPLTPYVLIFYMKKKYLEAKMNMIYMFIILHLYFKNLKYFRFSINEKHCIYIIFLYKFFLNKHS